MGKINSIQYLRALAALLVVTFHCSNRVGDGFPDGVEGFLRVGGAGVDLFFVISGFIMWTISAARPTTPGEFALRRITRVVPTYWIMTTVWVAIAFGVISWVTLDPLHVIQSYLFIPHFSPDHAGKIFPVLVPGWTLIYEMFFYAIFSLCLFLPSRFRLAALSAALAGLVLFGWAADPKSAVLETYTNPLLLEFLGGVLIGYLWGRRALPSGLFAMILLAIGVVALAASMYMSTDPEEFRVAYWGAPSALIVAGALGVPALQGRQPLLLALGNASYSIYLSHIIYLTFLAEVMRRSPFPPKTLAGGLLFMLVGFVGACVIGWLIYRFVEQPLEAFFRRRTGVKGSPAPVPQAAPAGD